MLYSFGDSEITRLYLFVIVTYLYSTCKSNGELSVNAWVFTLNWGMLRYNILVAYVRSDGYELNKPQGLYYSKHTRSSCKYQYVA